MTARLTLALLFVIPALMASPWETTAQRWVLGAAGIALVVLFAWWRGAFATDMVRRRAAMWRRNHTKGTHAKRHDEPAESTSVALQCDDSNTNEVPLILLAGYLDRYGVRARKIRVTSRDAGGRRTTWVAMTIAASDNLAALQARSARIPLRDTAEIATRRLADHLRESGNEVGFVDAVPTPWMPSATETWRGLRADDGHLSAYRVKVDDALERTLAGVWSHPAEETWTAIEISGDAARPAVAVVVAYRTPDRPGPAAPVRGLAPMRCEHGRALEAMDPSSVHRLPGAPVRVPAGLLDSVGWPAGRSPVTAESVTDVETLSRT